MTALWSALAVLGAGRVIALMIAPVELHGDEAQYWMWAQSLEWGYYSKPPLIAWVIAATTAVFGDAEWAIRLGAPIAHTAAAVFIGLLARDLAGARAGLAAGVLYATMPGVWLSSGVVSTDAFMLPSFAAALYCLNRLRDGAGWVSAVGLGAAIGIGVLAKYAMVYFAVGIGLVTVFDPATRRAVLSLRGALAAAIALALVAPNLLWNAANDFATVSHTADNANWTGPRFRVSKLLEFWSEQLPVFGLIAVPLLIAALSLAITRRDAPARSTLRWLAAFTIPVLAVVSAQAFINRAHANWAAAAYVAASVAVAVWAVSAKRERLLAAAIAINVAFGLTFAASAMAPRLADRICVGDDCVGEAFKRARGWRDTAEAIAAIHDRGHAGGGFDAVVFDNRLAFHTMEYYADDRLDPLRMWRREAGAKSHAEQRAPLTAEDGDWVLVISERPREHARIAADFAEITTLETITIELGAGQTRTLTAFAARGFNPLTRDADYVERFGP